jgi:hypothetical protein
MIWCFPMSKGNMVKIVVSGLAAGLFVFIVFNITSLRASID